MRTIGLTLVGIGTVSAGAAIIIGDWRFLIISVLTYLAVRKTA